MVDEVLGREIRLAERGEEEECIAVEASGGDTVSW